jgi:hypothetical protein
MALILLTSNPADNTAYEAARARAGKDPAKLLKLALWCEAHGMDTEKKLHLEESARLDPKGAAAHGLLGLLDDHGQWVTPEAVAARTKADEALAVKLADYNIRRDQIEREAKAERAKVASFERSGLILQARTLKFRLDRHIAPHHIKLAMWCEQNGLKPEALAHFTTALQLNPHDETTWRHMGYVKHHGRWMSHEQIAAEHREDLAQKHADRHWEPLLRKWVAELRNRLRREEAEANLAKVQDPRAVRSIIRLFGDVSLRDQALAVRLLGQIDAPASTRELAYLAVYSDFDEVRQAAARGLRGREPRDYAQILVSLIHTPVQFEVQPVAGPGSRGGLVVDSPRFHLTRTYEAPLPFRLGSTFGGYAGYDANGLPILLQRSDARHLDGDIENGDRPSSRRRELELITKGEARAAELIAEANVKAGIVRERLATDVRDLVQGNAQAEWLNQRVSQVLTAALDAPPGFGDDEDAWRSWYYEKVGYRYTPPPKVTIAQNGSFDLPAPTIVSCFAAGTPVRTLEGLRPIEAIRPGDQVLAQDVATGALSFQPVVTVHHNPPDQTLRIATDRGDAVVASRFHRFWLAGRGWAMARDLRVGEVLRTLNGPARITAVEVAPIQPVFNLDVARSRTYFVGATAMLVHDNTLPPSHSDTPPFDGVPRFETIAEKPD